MSFLFTWLLWSAAVILPAIAAMYFFKRRHRELKVSALFLWINPSELTGGGRRLSRIEKNILLLIELLIAALLICAAAGPGCGEHRNINQAVVILDSSASMSAIPESGGQTVKAKASAEIVKRLRALSPFSCTVIQSGRESRITASSLTDIPAVEKALEKWEASSPPHDFEPAFQLGIQLAGKHGHVFFCTDSMPPKTGGDTEFYGKPSRVEWLAFGSPSDNAALTGASRKKSSDGKGEEIFAVAANYSGREIQAEMRLDTVPLASGAKAETIGLKKISIPPGERVNVTFKIPAVTDIPYRLTLSPGGALAADDTAILVPDYRPAVKICPSLKKNPDMAKLIEKTFSSLPPGAAVISAADSCNLLLTDETALISAIQRDAWSMLFESGDGSGKDTVSFNGPYILAKAHFLLDGINLEGIRWSVPSGAGERKPFPGAGIVSCGENMLIAEVGAGVSSESLNFVMRYVPERSNLHKTVSWPVMMNNLVRARAAALPGLENRNIRSGESARAFFPDVKVIGISHVPSDGTPVRKIPMTYSKAVFTLDEPGLYSVAKDGGGILALVSCNFFYPEESDMRKCISGAAAAENNPENQIVNKVRFQRDESWIFLLSALALCILRAFIAGRREKEVNQW